MNDSGSRTAVGGQGSAPDLRALARTAPVHLIGIAGAGMSALAELLLRSDGRVTGCDLRPGHVGDALRAAGADVVQGHDPAHVADAAAVVVTAAVPSDHPELEAAREHGIPVLKRAEALGSLVNRGRVVAIAGTHGKTTTTAMTTAIAAEAGLDPTGFVGGRVPGWGGGLRPGGDQVFVVEADEYDRAFHTLRPEVAVVNAVEADHLDIYGSVDAVEDAFRRFLAPVPPHGRVIGCSDDAGVRRLLASVEHAPTLAFGLGTDAVLRAVDVRRDGRATRFRVVEDGRELGELRVSMPGIYNVRNALAAFAAARQIGADFAAAARALDAFQGVGRRFQELGTERGVTVVDDYAHHPTELAAALAAAREAYPERRIVAVFQPHLYTRTRDFADGFGRALAAADAVWVTDVYPAREPPIEGVTGELVARAAHRATAPGLHYVPDRAALAPALAGVLKPGDVCITMGAGDIDETARELLECLRAAAPAASGREARP